MGFWDFISDLTSSLTITDVSAEEGSAFHTGDDHQSGQDQAKSKNAQQSGEARVAGGASQNPTPAAAPQEGGEEAEANKEDTKKPEPAKGHKPGEDKDENVKQAEAVESSEEEAEEEGPPDAEEEEDEDDDEPKDLMPKFQEECAQSAQCAPHKHHYDECVERVTKQMEESDDGKASEDCVEEYFHLMHCAAQCAAPKLFRALK